MKAFGGQIEKLRKDWLVEYARAQRRRPLRVGQRLVVMAEAPKKSGIVPQLIIPAGAAFGTGEHATTAMSLRLLERITRPLATDWTSGDLGTGSGILALAARSFGARHVIGIDNDPSAISTAQRNARMNRVRGVHFEVADVLTWRPRQELAVITANLFSELLIEVLPKLTRYLAVPGWLIASGIMRSQETSVMRALRQNGMAVTEVRRRGKWIALAAAHLPRKRCLSVESKVPETRKNPVDGP
jgi:ribosomal protein L11 methyltransferase